MSKVVSRIFRDKVLGLNETKDQGKFEMSLKLEERPSNRADSRKSNRNKDGSKTDQKDPVLFRALE